jgi:serine/threonine protein phosphatase PrpC
VRTVGENGLVDLVASQVTLVDSFVNGLEVGLYRLALQWVSPGFAPARGGGLVQGLPRLFSSGKARDNHGIQLLSKELGSAPMLSADSIDDEALYRVEVTAPTDKVCGMTECGWDREKNEDAYWVEPDLGFLIVADGLGGLPGGAVASGVAVAELAAMLREPGRPLGAQASEAVEERLRAAFSSAHSCILHEAAHEHGARTMATTAVAAWVTPSRVYTAHVGDSRAYVFREGEVIYRTRDHSVAEDLVRRGELDEAMAREHPEADNLTVVLGGVVAQDPVLAFDAMEIRHGDTVLLCTDGLWKAVPETELGEVIARETSAAERAGELMRRALDAGGSDNITVVLYEHH